jgi:hypothetical protein
LCGNKKFHGKKAYLGIHHWKPSLEKLKQLDISFKVVKQQPGDLIYVGYGSYHWVFADVSH